jgi:hypothetical protein
LSLLQSRSPNWTWSVDGEAILRKELDVRVIAKKKALYKLLMICLPSCHVQAFLGEKEKEEVVE